MRRAVQRCISQPQRCIAASLMKSNIRCLSGTPQYEPLKTDMSPVEAAVTNLLYNIPSHRREGPRLHTITALLSNEPGVLSRVSGTLAGRGYNIDSLVVCATEVPQISRATIVMKNCANLRQVKRDLEDIVQVWAVVEYLQTDSVLERELLLVKVNLVSSSSTPQPVHGASTTETATATRQSLVELTKLFGGKVLDLTNETMIMELCAKASRIDAFIKLVQPFGVAEFARSGRMAMMRGGFSGFEREVEVEKKMEVSAEDLPPG